MLNSTLADKGILRVRDWWWSKAALLMGMVYLLVAWLAISFTHFVVLALLSLTTICGFASVGYLFNDLFDRQKDTLAGKKNFLAHRSVWFIALCFLVGFAALLTPWLCLPFTVVSAGLIVAELMLFLVYSIPAVRLKEKGIAGIIADAGYAHVVPVVLAAYTFALAAHQSISFLGLTLLLGWQLLSGIRNILLHQHDDLLQDAKAGNKNYVAGMAEAGLFSAIKYLITVEVVVSILFFAVLAVQQSGFVLCAVVIAVWSAVTVFKFRLTGMPVFMNTYWKHFPNNVYEKWIPVATLLLLTTHDIRFVAVLLLHLLLFNFEFCAEVVKRIYPVLRDTWIVGIRIPLSKFFSALINYPIYYLFLMFGVNLKKENLSAFDYLKKRSARKP